jgi:hypothetical protein
MTTTATGFTGYAASTALVCTVNGLAQSLSVGRQCTVTTNTVNRYVDGLVTVCIPTGTGTSTASRSAYISFFGSEDAVVFDGDDARPGASDAGYTIGTGGSNMKGPVVMYCPKGTATYFKTIPLSSVFPVMPRVWGFVVTQDIMPTLGTATDTPSFTGYTEKLEY